ncbi:hypothetical protein [Paracoccus aminovorans]|uniref:hypothetical protein n=1 Tax=Paracoccus aminovorans TaxID=34004 RepID=UPI002B25A848|nr:hypothetical protein [Paracoccus aminovorans]
MQIDNRISRGNIFVLGSMVVGGAAAWGTWTTTTSLLAAKLADQAASLSAHEARIRAMETTARQDERPILILDGLRMIDARLDTGPHP